MEFKVEVLYVNDVAKIFGVTRQTIYKWEREGLLHSYQTPSGRRYYKPEDIEKFFSEKRD